MKDNFWRNHIEEKTKHKKISKDGNAEEKVLKKKSKLMFFPVSANCAA